MALTTIKTSQLRDGAKFLKSDGTVLMTADLNLNDHKITNVTTPVNDKDAANKAYVDATRQGLDPKESVRALETVSNVTLSGTQTRDGVALSVDDRCALNAQTNPAENGLWVVKAGSWERPTDFVTGRVTSGAYFFVESGTLHANSGWILTTTGTITIGTTPLSFTQFNGAADVVAGDGMTKTGNTLNVVTASSSRIVVNADNIDLATTGVTAGTYTKITVDVYGRATSGASATTQDITEHSSNLYFTNARAQTAMTGAISTVVTSDLTASKALVSDASGKIAASSISSTELGYLSGVSGGIQTQINTILSTYLKTANYIAREVPTGSIDGVNDSFSLANIPVSGSELVYLNGVLQNPAGDYGLTTDTVKFTVAPEVNDSILVTYLKPYA